MKRLHFTRQFNWRMLLVRTLVNALALLVITILPDIHFVDPTVLRVLFVALILGVLNAFVKPIIQFLTLRFIFITYGFAVVIINAIMLWLLNVLLPNIFNVDRLIWALIAGALFGLISSFFENLLGLQVPIIPDATGLLPEPGFVASSAFESRVFSGVIGESEELVAEDSLDMEAVEAVSDAEIEAVSDTEIETESGTEIVSPGDEK